MFQLSIKTPEGLISLYWYGVTLIKKLKLQDPTRILRKQEWSERRLELKKEARSILKNIKKILPFPLITKKQKIVC
ncbi:hypothetical protein C2W64_01596 [Brevibacillus laterosporus]|nr:hypothetical protein C2W64_01596 [Brevibacillus laterosporus]